MKTEIDSPIEEDVSKWQYPKVRVPHRWVDVSFEYKVGYWHGYNGSNKSNPIKQGGPLSIRRREAFTEGRRQGRKVASKETMK